MSQNRRTFLKTAAAAAGGMAALGPDAASAATPLAARTAGVARAAAPKRILILGGTGFTGPYQVRYAVERGHEVTVFNRGRRQAELPAEVEQQRGDRNTGDYASLEGRTWDVVIDNPTSLPFWARDAASLLQDAADRYIFISTISVYADMSRPGMDEDAPLAVYEGQDPLAETMETFRANVGQLYGPLKAESERQAQKYFDGRTAVVRPGLIVGPGDESDRFTYWPVRIARGGDVLAPGDPTDPVQLIDARDLAEWVIRLAEDGTTGVFNATGPRSPLSIAEMLHGIRASQPGDNEIRFVWAPAEFLQEQNVAPWGHMPVWLPPTGETAGAGLLSIERAVRAGLTFRPLATTAADTLAWFRALPAERQAQLRAGIAAEREAEVVAALRGRSAGG